MRSVFFASVYALAAVAGAAEATSVAPPGIAASPQTGEAAVATADPPKTLQAVSPQTAAKLAAAAAKYVPPPEPPTPEPERAPVARETEGPKNPVVRLPSYIVGEPKLRIPQRDFQVLTPKGRVELAFNRWPGLRFGPFAHLNAPIGLEMLEDELRVQRRAEAVELWTLHLVRETKESDVPQVTAAK